MEEQIGKGFEYIIIWSIFSLVSQIICKFNHNKTELEDIVLYQISYCTVCKQVRGSSDIPRFITSYLSRLCISSYIDFQCPDVPAPHFLSYSGMYEPVSM